jgi:hypothetical protein
MKLVLYWKLRVPGGPFLGAAKLRWAGAKRAALSIHLFRTLSSYVIPRPCRVVAKAVMIVCADL